MKQELTIETTFDGKVTKTETIIVDTIRQIKVGEGIQDLLSGKNKKTVTKVKPL